MYASENVIIFVEKCYCVLNYSYRYIFINIISAAVLSILTDRQKEKEKKFTEFLADRIMEDNNLSRKCYVTINVLSTGDSTSRHSLPFQSHRIDFFQLYIFFILYFPLFETF